MKDRNIDKELKEIYQELTEMGIYFFSKNGDSVNLLNGEPKFIKGESSGC